MAKNLLASEVQAIRRNAHAGMGKQPPQQTEAQTGLYAMKKSDPTINQTSKNKMTGWFYLPHFGDDTTEAENDAFGRAHLVNYGKTFPRPKGFWQSWRDLISDILKG